MTVHFGTRMRRLRELLGVSQHQQARTMKCSQGWLSDIEGRYPHRWTMLHVRRYVEALGGKVEIVVTVGDHRITIPPPDREDPDQ